MCLPALGDHGPFVLQIPCPGVVSGGPEWGPLKCSAQGRGPCCPGLRVTLLGTHLEVAELGFEAGSVWESP